MNENTNSLNWFEIPVTDMERAKDFYEKIFGIKMEKSEMMGMHMAFFPALPTSGKASGCLCKSEYHTPSKEGVVIYLNANPDMQIVLDKLTDAGGDIQMPKTQISPEIGYMAFFIDTEGNRVALHSQA